MTTDSRLKRIATKVTLEDGTVIYAIHEDHLVMLSELTAERIWWKGAKTRLKGLGVLVGLLLGGLMTLSIWWPWITRVMQAILKDVPN